MSPLRARWYSARFDTPASVACAVVKYPACGSASSYNWSIVLDINLTVVVYFKPVNTLRNDSS